MLTSSAYGVPVPESALKYMSRKARVKSLTGVYHITNRGADKQIIFEDEADYHAFQDTLSLVSKVSEQKLFAYCLMDNHFHLLMREGTEGIGTTMKRIETRYVKWFNEKYQRSGPLFEGRFHSEPVETFQYFCNVVRYIYRNPIKAGIVDVFEDYPYSGWGELRDGQGKLLAIDELSEIAELTELVQFCRSEREEVECLDYSPNRKKVTDLEIREFIAEQFKCHSVQDCKALSKEEKSLLVKSLKKRGASHRAISRTTGISRRLIDKT